MGYMEQLARQYSDNSGPNDEELNRRLNALGRDIRKSWSDYKQYQETMHGEEIKDNPVQMLLVYLLRQGFLE